MENKVKVSIIIPVYNAGEFLRPCLDTLINQTLREIELVCVLDCPTDGSDKVVEEYAAKDDRIVVVKNEHNLNIGETRNVGIRIAQGKYVGFSDHDDTRKLDMYEKLYEAAEQGENVIVITGKLGNYVSQFQPDMQLEKAFLSILGRTASSHVTPCLYDRRFLLDNGISFIDNNTCTPEDTIFNAEVLSAAIARQSKVFAMPCDFYNHIDFNSNQNKSYSHWAFGKVLKGIHRISSIAESTSADAGQKQTRLSIYCIKGLYTSFIRECGKNGIMNTIRLFKTLKDDAVVVKCVANCPHSGYGLTISKRLFLIWLKKHCVR